MKKILVTLLCCFAILSLFAQQDSIEAAVTPRSYCKFSLGYLNNSVYNGRKDSVATPYLTPSFGYYDKSGFFIGGSLSYLLSANNARVDLFTIESGYDFHINKFDAEVSIFKSFYNTTSTNVKSEVEGGAGTSASYDFGFIRPSLQGGINFSKTPDYAATFSVEHSFFAAGDKLEIVPSILLNASTQNYYGSYYSKRRYGRLKKKNGANPVYYDISADVSQASEFKLLDYELSVPISYSLNNFTFALTPVFAVPVNPAIVTVNIKPSSNASTYSKTFTEKLDNSFFFSFELSYRF